MAEQDSHQTRQSVNHFNDAILAQIGGGKSRTGVTSVGYPATAIY